MTLVGSLGDLVLTSPLGQVTKGVNKHKDAPIKVFVAFQLFGLFGLLIVLAIVIFSRSAPPRHAAWYSFAISWVISTISYTLLFWGGHLSSFGQPPYALCLIQSVLVYASPPLTAFTTLALVVQIWYLVHSVVVQSSQTKGVQGRPSQMILTILLILPYLLFVAMIVGTLVLGMRDPSIVRRVASSGMYCTYSDRIPGRISTFLCATLMLPAVILEVLICRALNQQWIMFKQQPYGRSMAIRVVLFTFVGLLAIAFSLVFFFTIHHGAALNIVLSLMPVSAVLIFGTQNDVIQALMFWKKGSGSTDPFEEVEIEREKDLHTNGRSAISAHV